jgi:hypothetical protein
LTFARPRWQAKLELRLDERDRVRVVGEADVFELGHGVAQREIGEVERYEFDLVRDEFRVQVAKVGAFEVDHSRVLPQRSKKLPVASVDGIDAARAGVEEYACEAADRRADVERDSVADADIESAECRPELRLAP